MASQRTRRPPFDESTLKFLQKRIAEGAVGPSALRNQGNRNVVARARGFLGKLDLSRLVVRRESDFRKALDRHTEKLRRALPPRARHWGTARKALNLFLRDVLYNRYLSDHFSFPKIEAWLEVPLDSYVADGLAREYLLVIPKWRGVKHVSAPESEQFQRAAREIAHTRGIAPVHLDIYWWRNVGKLRDGALNTASPRARR